MAFLYKLFLSKHSVKEEESARKALADKQLALQEQQDAQLISEAEARFQKMQLELVTLTI